jgi:hypothetical protein
MDVIVRCLTTVFVERGNQQKKLYESRASGMRPLDVALAEARIITENVYVQRKRRKWEEVSTVWVLRCEVWK